MPQPNFVELAEAIRQSQASEGMPVRLIAVDGHGGSGKTVLAKHLAQLLDAEILHTDDFASYDNPMKWWPRLVNEALEPIKNGVQQLSYPRGAWYKDHQPEPVTNQPVTPIMIVEGVSSSRKEFRPYLAYAIWVDTPKEVCLERGIARDLANNEANKTLEQLQQDWDTWHSYEDEYIQRDQPQEYADSIVSGESN